MNATRKDLVDLEASGLIRLAQIVPELEYLFHHAMVQDAVYASLLVKDRRQIHSDVGRTLERLFPDRQDELSPVLAHHFEKAGDDSLALEHYIQAGDIAAAKYANAEAIYLFRRALELAVRLEKEETTLVVLCNSLGRALELNAEFDQALKHYQDMEELGRNRSEPHLSLEALMGSARLRTTLTPVHDRNEGKILTEKALAMAQDLEDREAQVTIMWNLANLHAFFGKLSDARDLGEEALDLARDLGLEEQAASILKDLTHIYIAIGPLSKAKERIRDSRRLWRKLGNLPMLADSLSTSGGVLDAMGEYEQALVYGEEALDIGRSIDNSWTQAYSQVMVGFACRDLGNYGRAIANLEESIRICESIGLQVVEVYAHMALSDIYGGVGELARCVEEAKAGLDIAEPNLPYMVTMAMATLAQAHLSRGELVEAERAIKQGRLQSEDEERLQFSVMLGIAEDELALRQNHPRLAMTGSEQQLKTLRQLGMISQIPGVLTIRAKALIALSMNEEARASLVEACELSVTMQARPLLWPALTLLSQLEVEKGNNERAAELLQESQEVVSAIALETPAVLRRNFLNLPAVRDVTDPGHRSARLS